MNGNGKWWITLGITILLACVGGAFMMGSHIGNAEIHQSQGEKTEFTQKTVDRSIDREIKPMFGEIQRRLTSLENSVEELKAQ